MQLEINPIGHAALVVDGKEFAGAGMAAKLKVVLQAVKERLGPDSQRRHQTELDVLDWKLESEQEDHRGVAEHRDRRAMSAGGASSRE